MCKRQITVCKFSAAKRAQMGLRTESDPDCRTSAIFFEIGPMHPIGKDDWKFIPGWMDFFP